MRLGSQFKCETNRKIVADNLDTIRRGMRSGFTLIELLVVIALTLTLIALLFGPLVSSFNTTAQAQLEARAHDSGRLLMNQLVRELSSAVALRDTGGGMMYGYVMAKVNPNDSTGTEVLVHMPGAYTDIVPPQLMFQNYSASQPATVPTVTDPTTGRNLVLEDKHYSTSLAFLGTTAVPVEPDMITPIAPDNIVIRYFMGLKYPFNLGYTGAVGAVATPQPYTNIYDGEQISTADTTTIPGSAPATTWASTDVIKGALNNTYIMYRAVVRPYSSTGTGTPTVNTALFDTTTDSAGNTIPVLDDPDFFRIVTDGDSLPASSPYFDRTTATNNTYGIGGTHGSSLTATHNMHVYQWFQVSHPLINVSDADSLAYLRPGNQLSFDAPVTIGGVSYVMPATELNAATQQPTIGMDTDGVTPLVPPTVTISPGGALQEAATPQLTADISNGVSSANYLPTVYKTSQGQIQGYPTVTITAGANIFTTSKALAADVGTTTLVNGSTVASADLVEYGPATLPTAVYDITQASAVTGKTAYVAVAYDPGTGSFNFAVQATPPVSSAATADSSNPRNAYWAGVPSPLVSSIPSSNLILDLAAMPSSPLGAGLTPAAQIVVNSEQVRGPDKTPGPTALQPAAVSGVVPAQYSLVPYARVSDPGQVGVNQYAINYATGELILAPASAWGTDLASPDPQKNTVLVSYKVQNNSNGSPSLGPATVTVSYSSSSLVTISMGVRVYDTATKIAAFFNQTNTVAIGSGSH